MAEELIVLVDEAGTAIGTLPKGQVHHGETPLHRAFSAYLFDDDRSAFHVVERRVDLTGTEEDVRRATRHQQRQDDRGAEDDDEEQQRRGLTELA